MFQKSEIFFNKFTQIKYQDKQDKQAQSLDLPSLLYATCFSFLSGSDNPYTYFTFVNPE